MHSYIEWSTMSIFIRSSHRFTLWVWCITFCCNSLHVTVAIHSYQTIPDLSNHSQQHQRIETTAHSMVHNLFMTHAFANIIQLLYVLCIMAWFFFLNSVYIFWFQPQLTWDIAQVVTCCQCSDSLMIHCYSLLTRETFNLLCLCHANQSCHKQLSCLFISTWNVNMVSLIALPIPTFPYISYIVHIVHIVLRIVESDCGFENILAKRFLVAFKAKPHRQSHLLCRTRLSRVVTRCLPAFTRNGFRVAQYP